MKRFLLVLLAAFTITPLCNAQWKIDSTVAVPGSAPPEGKVGTVQGDASGIPLPVGPVTIDGPVTVFLNNVAAAVINPATEDKQDAGNLSLSNLDTNIPAQGQAPMAASVPVVLANDQSPVTVTLGDAASNTVGAVAARHPGHFDTTESSADISTGTGTPLVIKAGVPGKQIYITSFSYGGEFHMLYTFEQIDGTDKFKDFTHSGAGGNSVPISDCCPMTLDVGQGFRVFSDTPGLVGVFIAGYVE